VAGAMAPARQTAHPGMRRTALPGGNRKRTAFPRRCGRLNSRPAGPGITQASARWRRDGRWPGALAAGWKRDKVALWQGRWPLPGCARRAQAEEFPAFRSGSPCDRHFFSTPGVPHLTNGFHCSAVAVSVARRKAQGAALQTRRSIRVWAWWPFAPAATPAFRAKAGHSSPPATRSARTAFAGQQAALTPPSNAGIDDLMAHML